MKKALSYCPGYKIYNLRAGECLVTSEPNAVLTTLLGFCVAVCLIDEKNSIIGMSHIMLLEESNHARRLDVEDTKKGTCAIDKLVKDMVATGADPKHLKARVYGAGQLIEYFFVKNYLSSLNIPVIAEVMGANWGSKLFFFSQTKDVLLKRIAVTG